MDKALLRATLVTLRSDLHRALTNVPIFDGWETLQAADHLIEHLDGQEEQFAKKDVMAVAKPYLEELGRLKGMLKVLKEQHPVLNRQYDLTKISPRELEAVGLGLWHLLSLEKNGNNE